MLSAQNGSGERVLAWDVTKDDGPFTCPECKHAVRLRKGAVKIHHFAHVPPVDCFYGIGESEIHRRAKVAIYERLLTHPQVTKLQLERLLGEVRPDISFYFKSVPVAIEVQVSTLSVPEIVRRTEAYTRKGIYMLWAPPLDPQIKQEVQYSLKAWEKFLHALYFGRILYWEADDLLQPIVYGPSITEIPLNTWYNPRVVQRDKLK